MPKTRVVVVEDENLMREALIMFLSTSTDLQVVGTHADGTSAVQACPALDPDVVLMDIRLPPTNGIEATRRICQTRHAQVLALTALCSQDVYIDILRAGACGLQLKGCSPPELVEAVHAAAAGRGTLNPMAATTLVAAIGQRADTLRYAHPTCTVPDLSTGERQVLELLAQGLNTTQIAHELVLSEAAIKSRVGRLLRIFHVDSRVQLLVRTTELGMVTPRLRRPDLT